MPIEDFYWRNKAKGIRRSECKYCHSSYVKSKYYQHKADLNILKASFHCAKCGEDRAYCLDFHHKDATLKEDTIARMTSHQAATDKLQQELEKCVVLCANCHREFHYLQYLNGLTIDDYLL